MAQETQILTQKQTAFLEFVAREKVIVKSYYLTGGTPLAAFYLHHRYSEDLDFFTEEKEVNLIAVQKVIKNAKQKLDVKNVSYQNFQGLHTFFFEYTDGDTLKVDFNFYPFPRIEKGYREFGIAIDSLLDIAVNKVQSIATRTKARDFVDLYYIVKEKNFALKDLIATARNKFDFYIDPVQYGKQFIKVRDVKDYPRMVKPLNTRDLENFFLAEAAKLKTEILE